MDSNKQDNDQGYEEWDYKENMFIEPCACHQDCGNYILCMKGNRTHFKKVPDDVFVDVATLSVSDLYDLCRIVHEQIDLQIARDELEEQFNK